MARELVGCQESRCFRLKKMVLELSDFINCERWMGIGPDWEMGPVVKWAQLRIGPSWELGPVGNWA